MERRQGVYTVLGGYIFAPLSKNPIYLPVGGCGVSHFKPGAASAAATGGRGRMKFHPRSTYYVVQDVTQQPNGLYSARVTSTNGYVVKVLIRRGGKKSLCASD